MDRPKKGFGIPIASWMQNEIAFLLDEYLNEHDIQHQGLFNWEPIKQIVAAFKAGKLEYTNKVWYLLVFQMWYKKWMK
jgi:asparagine synthase (glutamine-hydrolysing)